MARRRFQVLLTSPVTWAAVVTIGALEWGVFAWFRPSLLPGAIAIVLGGLLLAAWPILFVRSDGFVRKLYALPASTTQELSLKLEALRADLAKVGCDQGLGQVDRLGEKFNTLCEILDRRMDAGELTYGRYRETGYQVYLSAIDNLNEVAIALTSVSSVDRDYIDNRLKEIVTSGGSGAVREREIETLEQRRSTHEDQLEKVANSLGKNETIMTALVNTATALADAKTTRGHAAMDADTALAALEELASRAGKYAAATRS